MQFKKWIITLPLVVGLLSGCSVLESLVYRINIAQGNYIEQQAVNKLRVGMTKPQVEFVMGTPMLIESGYPNVWYYIYHYTHGHDPAVQKNMIAYFDNSGKLADIQGDFPMSPDFFNKMQ